MPALRRPPPPPPTRSTLIWARLHSPHFWRIVSTQWRPALKLTAIVNVSVLTVQLLLHGGLHAAEEFSNPTPPSLGFLGRYYLRMARMDRPWSPFSEPSEPSARRFWWDRVLSAGGDTMAAVRRERGAWCEKLEKWEDAEKEYSAALAATGEGREKVLAAGRLATIREWRGDVDGALAAIEAGVVAAGEGSGERADAKAELVGVLARKGEVEKALEVATEVLMERKGPGEVCKVAAAEAMVGELLFAVGKKGQGIKWSEAAFLRAWDKVEERSACKECCKVAAANLVTMAGIMEKEVEAEKKGWWKGDREERLREARRIRREYEIRALEVAAVKR